MSVSNQIETANKLFSNCGFEQIAKYSNIISDVNTYYCYMIVANLDNDMKALEKYRMLHHEAQEKLTDFILEIYMKHGSK